ncbi:hypothetical protein RUND412_002684 [Rhizina undulata]
MFEAREQGLAGVGAEVDSGNASEFSEISPVVAWAVRKNFKSSHERMDHEYLAETEQTEEDYENASEFSEIPLALVFQNSLASRDNAGDEDLAHTEIEDDLLSQFSEVSLSRLWLNGPITRPEMNSKVEKVKHASWQR